VPGADRQLHERRRPHPCTSRCGLRRGKNVWIVGGGDSRGSVRRRGLLDEVIVYVAPVTLGAGKPLLPRSLELRLEETARNGDFVCSRYSVASD
jgi:dihydrofolate reductase